MIKREPVVLNVSIPVKPHVKKYLSVRYGNEHRLTKTSLLGILIFQLLDKRMKKTDHDLSEYHDKYNIQITEYYFNTKGFDIPLKKRKFLAVCLEKLFIEDMNLFIDTCIGHLGMNALESLRKFLEKYAIEEDDVKIESLYRQYQRYCNENIMKKKNIV